MAITKNRQTYEYLLDGKEPWVRVEEAWNQPADAEDPAETVALAIASARRWADRLDLSPELRLRRMWTVLTTALEEA